jgi:CRP-like cAMP-binding protein
MIDLLTFIRSFSEFSDKSWDILRPIIIRIELKKGEHLIDADKYCNSLFFISKGYCRAFHLQDGTEINTNFYFEHDIATNINSYALNIRSSFTIQACEPLIAYRLDKDKIFEAAKLTPEIELVGKQNLQLIAARQEKQLELYRLLTATERYAYLEKNQPEILQRVSLTQLSSYLGVARETLSRIRKKRLKN